MAILTFAGKDATEMFEMVHEDDVIEKFAPECVIGTVKPSSKM
jgi:cytochrome b involved in lipid metabolism